MNGNPRFRLWQTFVLLCLALALHRPAAGADWPMWRADASRRASSGEVLEGKLYPAWERRYRPREMVWDDPLNQDLMPYDRVFEPVVAGKRMFVGFNDSDKLVCLDTDTGEQLWTRYTDGPVRMPPVAWQGMVYAACDDGFLYCLDQRDGSVVWKHRGAHADRRIIGNRRLISTWPARGGPVVSEGRVYYAASIWPFMGTFIHALDAATGEQVWRNDSTGAEYRLQPHHSPAFAGIAPQGMLVATPGGGLLIPGGRSVPAMFDRMTGSQRYYHLSDQNKSGGSFVCAGNRVFFAHHRDQVCSMYDLETGERLVHGIGSWPVIDDETVCLVDGDTLRCYGAKKLEKLSRWWLDGWFWERWLWKLSRWEPLPEWAGDILNGWIRDRSRQWRESELWKIAVDGSGDLIRAGGTLYAAGESGVTTVRPPDAPDGSARVLWNMEVPGGAARLLAADGKLFAVTLDGRIMAFAAREQEVRIYARGPEKHAGSPDVSARAARMLESAGSGPGYALVYGLGDGGLLEELATGSDLRVVGIDPDPAKVESIRRRLDSAGLYGRRVAVHRGTPAGFPAPPYMARLIVMNTPPEEGEAASVLNSLRPYGGELWLRHSGGTGPAALETMIAASGVANIETRRDGGEPVLIREGPLPGAASWTHQYGDIANTAKSDDELVRLPLGLLWFGGSSNMDVLPRHGHGPPEQVVGGRLFIEGMSSISARDVYTGEVLWKTEIPGLDNFGVYYDGSYHDSPTSTSYNQEHLPGANIRGANFVATADRVYVAAGSRCIVLGTDTGGIIDEFVLPVAGAGGEAPEWGYIGVWEDLLVAGSGLVEFSRTVPPTREELEAVEGLSEIKRNARLSFIDFDNSASSRLIVLDRISGRALWSIDAESGFLHNGIAAAEGRIFLLDKLHPYLEARLARRGVSGAGAGANRLLALDIRSGGVLWEDRENVFGSWLSVSREHDILLQSTRPSRDMVRGEDGERMMALSAADGRVIWDRDISYGSVPILHGDRIVTIGRMNSLLTGEQITDSHPLTGETVPVTWRRNYGCNYPIASEHLLTFRSAAAGFYDLSAHGGTGNMGGFKSGCTSNLVAADGVLNAPDYTRTCACSYQNQTSLAMIHDPPNEFWTFNDIGRGSEPVRRMGINFGAPGDRAARNGTLWLDFPSVGGPSPEVPVRVEGESIRWFYDHSSAIGSGEGSWITSSGVNGARSITVSLAADIRSEGRPYTLRLFFRPGGGGSFNVSAQGRRVIESLDLAVSVEGGNGPLVREIRDVVIEKDLVLAFEPLEGEPSISGIELIAEN